MQRHAYACRAPPLPVVAVATVHQAKWCAEGGKGGKKKRVYGDDGMLFCVHWRRVVLDEAQLIKNNRTKMAQAAWQLHATHRFARC